MQRPVFTLLDRGPLSRICSFVSYDNVEETSELKHLSYTSEAIFREYEETPEADIA